MTTDLGAPRARILVVDDVEANRVLAEALLVREGYEVVLAEDGAAALRAFDPTVIDLVLLDIMMPGLDGFATCKHMRAAPRGSDVPIVFLTSLNDLRTHQEALVAGADDFLTKPIQRTELMLRVNSLLRIKRLQVEQAKSYALIREQRDRLVEIERHRQETTALIVHDMKNPLTAVLGNAQYLATSDGLTEEQLDCTADIVGAASRMHRMVMNLLDLSRSETGVLVPRLVDVDLSRLAGEVQRELERRLSDKRQLLVVASLPSPPVVSADADLLGRLVMNLVENAMKYSPAGTTIELSAMRDPDGSYKLRVTDQGPGVPRTHRERIFENYVRLDEDEETARTSRGLGLASCRVAVEAHGGEIWVEDNPPRGAAFWVRLPGTNTAAP